jgi:hypothetical protein
MPTVSTQNRRSARIRAQQQHDAPDQEQTATSQPFHLQRQETEAVPVRRSSRARGSAPKTAAQGPTVRGTVCSSSERGAGSCARTNMPECSSARFVASNAKIYRGESRPWGPEEQQTWTSTRNLPFANTVLITRKMSPDATTVVTIITFNVCLYGSLTL